MSDTPRTDQTELDIQDQGDGWRAKDALEFARTLERELTALRAERNAEIAGLQKNVLAWVERYQQAQKDWDKEHATVDLVIADARANTQRWLDAESELTALNAELAALRAERDAAMSFSVLRATANRLREERDEAKQKVESLREALRLFLGCAIPVSSEIDTRGYSWSEAYLDQALKQALRGNEGRGE